MSKKGALFLLIKSLTKAEKRYLKLSIVSGNKKNYIQLFEFIDKQTVMDDEAVKQEFSGTDFSRQLHVTKNYLNSYILKNLRSFHENSNVRSRLNAYLTEIQVLYKKELFDHCRDRLNKSKKLAETYECFNHLLEIIHWQRKVENVHSNSSTRNSRLTQLILKEREIIEKISNLNQYQQFTYELMSLNFHDTKQMKETLNHQLLRHSKCARSFAAMTLYYHIVYIVKTVSGENKEGRKALLTLIDKMEQRPELIKDSPENYIIALNNLMGMLLYFKETDDVIAYLQKIREVPRVYGLKEEKQFLKMLIKTYNIELELYRDLKNWGKGEKFIAQVHQFINDNIDFISGAYRVSLYYQFSYIFFMRKKYSEALKSLNIIFSSELENERIDIQIYARFLQLMVHFELGNTIVLKYSVENVRRYLKKRDGRPEVFQVRLLRLFSKLSTVRAVQYPSIFDRYGQSLFDGVDEKRKLQAMDYIDFDSWIKKGINKN